MSRSRLDTLLEYYKAEPNDPFTIYALALEYSRFDQEKTQEFFDLLLKDHEQYLPAYYHAALYYRDHGKREKAISIYKKGIQLAESQHEAKALRELRSAYDEMLFE